MAHASRSTKRHRGTSSSKLIVIIASGDPPADLANGQEEFTRDPDFWLDDGNLILLVGDAAFRVYQGLLIKKSVVFADMFAAASADATDTFDGCPVVRLPDHPEDLRDFLQYLMPCSELRLHDGLPTSDFSELHAAIQLAHKYKCPDVETHALSVLKKYYTPHFTEYLQYDASRPSILRPPHDAAIAAVNLARLTDTPSMLPFALYRVCTLEGKMLDGYRRRNGSIEYLSPADVRLCIDARAELAKQMVVFVNTVFTRKASAGCKTVGRCIAALNHISEQVELNAPGACDVLDSYDKAIEDWAGDFGLCGVCKREMLDWEVAERRRVWKLLPGIFGFTAAACGFTIAQD